MKPLQPPHALEKSSTMEEGLGRGSLSLRKSNRTFQTPFSLTSMNSVVINNASSFTSLPLFLSIPGWGRSSK
ncbi:hypothetical protein HOLleu_26613 [Holothuria leucospilota]|uniref:Uncharacterized protein n=1 Tax=Holothuria leucospilota TaxID=206669 RepID=A0A9Q1BP65_HOLLE|nr:hypothetical protein HOLleu_26613 [Holothuria leucospilota]